MTPTPVPSRELHDTAVHNSPLKPLVVEHVVIYKRANEAFISS